MLWAYDFQSGDLYYNITSNVAPYTVEVTSGNTKYSGDITIPSSVTYNGITYAVTGIGYQAFYKCSSLTSVTIPNSVTSIGTSAFEGCSSLTSVTIPSSVTSIGSYAFSDCSTLTSITIPNSVTSIGHHVFNGCVLPKDKFINNSAYTSNHWGVTLVDKEQNGLLIKDNVVVGAKRDITTATIPNGIVGIGGGAFRHCSSLTSVTIPNSVTSIEDWAFGNCSSLTSVTIPNSVTSIGYHAFYGCSSLTSVTIPEGVTSIGGGAFADCSSLTSVTIPNSVTSIGWNAFKNTGIFNDNSNCENGVLYISNCLVDAKESLSGAYTIKNGTRIIADGAFRDCSSLTSVTIPSSVTSIEGGAFMDCKALTNVTISNGVMKIGGEAFRGCPSLTSVFIPSSVTSIGTNPFYGCPGIISIVVDENNPKYDSRNNCNGIIETATNRLITGCQNTIIPYGVTNIDHAFCGCSSLKQITIPNTVANIGKYTFGSCSLTSIVIPKSVTSIGNAAFINCPLSTIVVEEGNPKYDSRNNCNAIIITSTNTLLTGSDNTIIPEGITAISPNAFHGRKQIASIAIPNTVTSIGQYAFNGCTSLTSITIPDGVTVIKTFAFSSCDALTSVIIGKGVNSFEQGAFFNSPVETVYFNAQEPAIGKEMVTGYRYFTTSPTCYIPCGTRAAYEASVWNDYMESFIETYEYTLTLSSSDNSTGSATITQEPACGTPAIIVATPNDGYFFSQWSDGNTDNPRTLSVTEDIELAAEFEEIGDYGFYSRNVHIGYNTICLPHGAIHFTGATFYEIAHILKNKKKIFFDEVKTLEAGKPYIFYPHSNEVTIYYDNTTSAVPLSHNGLHGTFDGITAASNFLKGKYLVAGNRMVLCGDGCSLAANRAYIVLDEISDKDHPAIPGIKRVSMDYSEENATTALDNITDESIVAPIQEGVYDILGRKVDAPTVSGFYIINGKKVFIAL